MSRQHNIRIPDGPPSEDFELSNEKVPEESIYRNRSLTINDSMEFVDIDGEGLLAGTINKTNINTLASSTMSALDTKQDKDQNKSSEVITRNRSSSQVLKYITCYCYFTITYIRAHNAPRHLIML